MTRTAAEKALDVLHKAVQPLAAYRAEPPEYPGHTLVPVADLERLEAAVYSATAFEDGAVQPERESMLFRVRGSDPASPEPRDMRICRLHGLPQDDPRHDYRYPDCENAGYAASPVAATEPRSEPLDVERLARAIRSTRHTITSVKVGDEPAVHYTFDAERREAEAIAAAYADSSAIEQTGAAE